MSKKEFCPDKTCDYSIKKHILYEENWRRQGQSKPIGTVKAITDIQTVSVTKMMALVPAPLKGDIVPFTREDKSLPSLYCLKVGDQDYYFFEFTKLFKN